MLQWQQGAARTDTGTSAENRAALRQAWL